MELFDKYPRIVLKDKIFVFSKEQLEEFLELAKKLNKVPLVSLYAFEEIRGKEPVKESAIIDKILFKGTLEECEEKCKMFSNYPSLILFDGEHYYAIIKKDSNLEELERLGACTQLDKMIIAPGYVNPKTKKESRIVKEYGR